jgi:hypothetical protein
MHAIVNALSVAASMTWEPFRPANTRVGPLGVTVAAEWLQGADVLLKIVVRRFVHRDGPVARNFLRRQQCRILVASVSHTNC